jgi:pullulanase/glycogen debranching enzyme
MAKFLGNYVNGKWVELAHDALTSCDLNSYIDPNTWANEEIRDGKDDWQNWNRL